MLEHVALEVFVRLPSRSYFFAFATYAEMKAFVKALCVAKPTIHVVNRKKRVQMAEACAQMWRRGSISNFEYIMKLNTLAGRSYNDLSQYPVFPWIVADYTSTTLDLNSPSTFRDLTKPVGALNEKRKAFVQERYNMALMEGARGGGGGGDEMPPFHYGSHYSSAGGVLYYLLRLEPFTYLHVAMQGGKIDHAGTLRRRRARAHTRTHAHTRMHGCTHACLLVSHAFPSSLSLLCIQLTHTHHKCHSFSSFSPFLFSLCVPFFSPFVSFLSLLADRLFTSVHDVWQSVTTHSADFKELVPEFFFLAETFTNTNRVNFGTCQSGEAVGAVALPPWAHGCPHTFVRMHRQALECPYVSSKLHAWIDLIFGYKQRGKYAVEATNV